MFSPIANVNLPTALFICLLVTPLLASAATPYHPLRCMNANEVELANLINDYRAENGKSRISLSYSLSLVAQWHIEDTRYAREVSGEFNAQGECNLNTWYGVPGSDYVDCCYTADHANPNCMWDKPAEITGGVYNSPGFELNVFGSSSPSEALNQWKQSSALNDVLLNQGIWASNPFLALGVGADVDNKAYRVWFGRLQDPNGTVIPCSEIPTLTITPSRQNEAIISWTPNSPGWILQRTTDVTAGSWSNVDREFSNGDSIKTTNHAAFRLVRPLGTRTFTN